LLGRFVNLLLNQVIEYREVGVATGYGLDILCLEPCWRQEVCSFLHLSSPALEPIQPPVQWLSWLFPGGKSAGTRLSPRTPLRANLG